MGCQCTSKKPASAREERAQSAGGPHLSRHGRVREHGNRATTTRLDSPHKHQETRFGSKANEPPIRKRGDGTVPEVLTFFRSGSCFFSPHTAARGLCKHGPTALSKRSVDGLIAIVRCWVLCPPAAGAVILLWTETGGSWALLEVISVSAIVGLAARKRDGAVGRQRCSEDCNFVLKAAVDSDWSGWPQRLWDSG